MGERPGSGLGMRLAVVDITSDSPSVVHNTPASSLCEQSANPSGLAGQSMSLVSVPTQLTSSNQIGPTPSVKPENIATAPELS